MQHAGWILTASLQHCLQNNWFVFTGGICVLHAMFGLTRNQLMHIGMQKLIVLHQCAQIYTPLSKPCNFAWE